jgi:hypothetical protein
MARMLPLLSLVRLRIAFLVAVVVALLGARIATVPLPIALLDSFDEAIALVSSAAEQRIAALEQQLPASRSSPSVAEALAELDREVATACQDARAALAAAIARLPRPLAPPQRATVLASIDRELAEVHRATVAARDPAVRLEHDATYRQLQLIRDLV